MVCWVVDACRRAGVERVVVVVGFGANLVRDALQNTPHVEFVEQTELLGTGHAVMMAAPVFAGRPACDVFVLAGDGPLIRPQTLTTLLAAHRQKRAAATLATALLDDPTGYGRVLRQPDGSFASIVEQKDATPQELAVREINPSYYCFRSDWLFDALPRVRNTNKQKEYYLTDVPGILRDSSQTVALVDAVPPEDVLSINTLEQLAQVDQIMLARLSRESSSRDQAARESSTTFSKGVR
jgi:bifunctional UDP-N-acetylglucosamine pyrophosphorylase/glucosamine-1-phosphate N-acetyltransferase